jgi:mitosis inhibitor protein kinase SWE1
MQCKPRTRAVFEAHHSDDHTDWFDANFRMLSSLGAGAFSTVYKVQHKGDGLMYAVKRAARPFTGYKDAILRLEEVEIMWHLSGCPYCVQLQAAWVQHGYLYLQMELCEGGSLQRWLDLQDPTVSIPEALIWQLLAEMTQGLKELHERDIVHLDLKPGNIFLVHYPGNEAAGMPPGPRYKIGDFGLAAVLPLPEDEEREGDRTYIAPEIISDAEYGKAADIFR